MLQSSVKKEGIGRKTAQQVPRPRQGANRKNHSKGLLKLLKEAAQEFTDAVKPNVKLPQVGIVGEIYLKFNAFAHKNITGWLMDHHIEVMPPLMTPFFMQAFVNRLTNDKFDLKHDRIPHLLVDFIYLQIVKIIDKVNKIGRAFPYFTPFEDIYEMANDGKGIINMAAQFGEGWLLPAEVIGFAKEAFPMSSVSNPLAALPTTSSPRALKKRSRPFIRK